MIIYSFLNVMVLEFNAGRRKILSRRYTDRSIGHNIRYLKGIWPGLHQHLEKDGWPDDFLKAAEAKMAED